MEIVSKGSASAIQKLFTRTFDYEPVLEFDSDEGRKAIKAVIEGCQVKRYNRLGLRLEDNPYVRVRAEQQTTRATAEGRSRMLARLSTDTIAFVTACSLLAQSIFEIASLSRRYVANAPGLTYNVFLDQFCFAALCISIECLLHVCVETGYPEFDYPDKWFGTFRIEIKVRSLITEWPEYAESSGAAWTDRLDVTRYRIFTWVLALGITIALMAYNLSLAIASLQPDGRVTFLDIQRPQLGLPSQYNVPAMISAENATSMLSMERCDALWTMATHNAVIKSDSLAVPAMMPLINKYCLNGTSPYTQGLVYTQMYKQLASIFPSLQELGVQKTQFPMSWDDMPSQPVQNTSESPAFIISALGMLDSLPVTPEAQLALSTPLGTPVVLNQRWTDLQSKAQRAAKRSDYYFLAGALWTIFEFVCFIYGGVRGFPFCWRLPPMEFLYSSLTLRNGSGVEPASGLKE